MIDSFNPQTMRHLDNLRDFNEKLTYFFGKMSSLLFLVALSNHAATPAYIRANSHMAAKYWYKLVSITVQLVTWTLACEYNRQVCNSLKIY